MYIRYILVTVLFRTTVVYIRYVLVTVLFRTTISWLSWQSAVRLSGFSASGQFAAAELSLNSTTKPLRRWSDLTQLLILLMAGDIHPNPGPTAKSPCPVCARDVTSRGVSYRCTRCTGWVHAKCSGLLNAAQYRRNKDWTCDPYSASKTQQPTPPPPSQSPNPAPSADQISDDSTFNVLQFNANGKRETENEAITFNNSSNNSSTRQRWEDTLLQLRPD